ncbi:MAG: hypothetical protein JXA82_00115 [Sedimentisphaerales bacterium]|nr:hypothetical protein [Sedimentisphaerales bacterium]
MNYAFLLLFLCQSGFPQDNSIVVQVDATDKGKPLKHVWQYFGYDECNYTTTPEAVDLAQTVVDMNQERVYLRSHFLLNNGDGKAALKWGSTNVYQENQQGEPIYSWQIMDDIMDTVVGAGALPLVEIGFMPRDLSSRPEPYRNSDIYRLDGGCFYAPKDYNKWADLIRVWAQHSKQRYPDVEQTWLWELWNEPNIGYFHGTLEEYIKLFDHTEYALHEVLPKAILGGPHTAGVGGDYLRNFLTHCAKGINSITGEKGTRLDYIGFHAKGGVRLSDGHVQMNLGNQLRQHRDGFSIVGGFMEFKTTPIIIGEADPDGCAACPSSRFPERGYRNVSAYAAYEVAMMKHTLDLAEQENVNLQGIVTWAWMFDGQPWFDGFRSLATNGVHKPVLNGFKMLGMLQGNRIPLYSSGAAGLDAILDGQLRNRADIDGFATGTPYKAQVVLWNYHDNLVESSPANIKLEIKYPDHKARKARIVHYRVDELHSNAYDVWLKMGSPQDPTPSQIQALKEAGHLEALEPIRFIPIVGGRLNLSFKLPRFAVSLIEVEWITP